MDAKICTKCKIFKWDDEFSIEPRFKDGLQSWCKTCRNKYRLEWSCNNREKQSKYQSKFEKNHPELNRAKTAKRKACKLNQTPAWANLNIIKQVYINCPKGKVVDHIIPLQGKLVSGFHHENNLQYLTPLENIKKGNKYEILFSF